MNDPSRPKVLIVDDHPMVRQGLALALEQAGFEVCAQASDVAAALAISTAADVAIVDLSLDGENGLDLIRSLREQKPALVVVVYSMFGDGLHVQQALAAGARAYVTKREAGTMLAFALREALAGRQFVSPQAAVKVGPTGRTSPPVLSGREIEVFGMLGEGASIQEVATELRVSTRTVESYCIRLQAKLELEGMRELRRHAVAFFRPR